MVLRAIAFVVESSWVDFCAFCYFLCWRPKDLWKNVHDHLLATKQWVANELAGTEGDFGHGCDCIGDMVVENE